MFTADRVLSAEQVVARLPGVFVLHLATVTAAGAPMLAPLDGLFYRGQCWFGMPPGAARIGQVRARPQVSATYSEGEDVLIMVHGIAREVAESSAEYAAYVDFCREAYGAEVWDYWQEAYRDREGLGYTASIEARRMFAMGPRPRG